jgi:hypothetical protein
MNTADQKTTALRLAELSGMWVTGGNASCNCRKTHITLHGMGELSAEAHDHHVSMMEQGYPGYHLQFCTCNPKQPAVAKREGQ